MADSSILTAYRKVRRYFDLTLQADGNGPNYFRQHVDH